MERVRARADGGTVHELLKQGLKKDSWGKHAD